ILIVETLCRGRRRRTTGRQDGQEYLQSTHPIHGFLLFFCLYWSITEPSSYSRVPSQRMRYGWRCAASGASSTPMPGASGTSSEPWSSYVNAVLTISLLGGWSSPVGYS